MAMTLITTNSGTNQSSMDFTSSIDSTYKLYIFKWYDVNPATDGTQFSFQANVDGASGYDETITSAAYHAYQNEDASVALLQYNPWMDQAQGTAFQTIGPNVGNGSDESSAGTLWLFNPSNTTYVKHFMVRSQQHDNSNNSQDFFLGGYFNATGAIDDIQFKMASGNFDGTIKMYGVG